jgi:hypothetical protein
MGKRVTLPFAAATFTVVGIAGAIKHTNLGAPPPPQIYYLGSQTPLHAATVLLKTRGVPIPAQIY